MEPSAQQVQVESEQPEARRAGQVARLPVALELRLSAWALLLSLRACRYQVPAGARRLHSTTESDS